MPGIVPAKEKMTQVFGSAPAEWGQAGGLARRGVCLHGAEEAGRAMVWKEQREQENTSSPSER